jgi:hypothetical protein
VERILLDLWKESVDFGGGLGARDMNVRVACSASPRRPLGVHPNLSDPE